MKKSVLMTILLLSLSFSIKAATPQRRVVSNLCIMSYNTHNCIGMDGKMDFGRIAKVISDVAPDVVALQELDSATTRNKGVYSLQELAKLTKMNYIYGPAIDYAGGRYGIGMLSKEKPIKVIRMPLPGREESRMLLIVEFKKYVLMATHFSLTEEDQKTSANMILAQAKILGKLHKPIFLAGDMNSVPTSEPQKILRKDFQPFTDSAWQTCEGTCIDYIYGCTNSHFKYSVKQKQMVEEKMASDHYPVFIRIGVSRR